MPTCSGALIGESAPLFDASEWKAVQPLVKAPGDPAKKPGATTDLARLEVVLDRILEKATSKSASDAIVSELASTARLTCASPDEIAAMNPGRRVPFLASAAESGRFFLKLCNSHRKPIGDTWGDATVALPKKIAHHTFRDIFTGETVAAEEGPSGLFLPVSKVFSRCPVALLFAESAARESAG